VLDANWNAKLIDFGHGSQESDNKERAFYSCTSQGGIPTKRLDYFAFGVGKYENFDDLFQLFAI
jgi:hypothetical protein